MAGGPIPWANRGAVRVSLPNDGPDAKPDCRARDAAIDQPAERRTRAAAACHPSRASGHHWCCRAGGARQCLAPARPAHPWRGADLSVRAAARMHPPYRLPQPLAERHGGRSHRIPPAAAAALVPRLSHGAPSVYPRSGPRPGAGAAAGGRDRRLSVAAERAALLAGRDRRAGAQSGRPRRRPLPQRAIAP